MLCWTVRASQFQLLQDLKRIQRYKLASTVIYPYILRIAYPDRKLLISLIPRPDNPIRNILELQFKQKRGRRRGHDQTVFDLEILVALGIPAPLEQRVGDPAEVYFQGAKFHDPLFVSLDWVGRDRVRGLLTGIIGLWRNLVIAEVEVVFQHQVTRIFDCNYPVEPKLDGIVFAELRGLRCRWVG